MYRYSEDKGLFRVHKLPRKTKKMLCNWQEHKPVVFGTGTRRRGKRMSAFIKRHKLTFEQLMTMRG